jgi:hypothetical protein
MDGDGPESTNVARPASHCWSIVKNCLQAKDTSRDGDPQLGISEEPQVTVKEF